VIKVLHDVGVGEEVVRGGVEFQEIRPVRLHFEFAGPVHLVDFDFRLDAGVNLHLDPASASLLNDFLELLRRIHHDRSRFERAADADRLVRGHGRSHSHPKEAQDGHDGQRAP